MFKQKHSFDESFNLIKKNHKDYLDTQMVTHLSVVGSENKKKLTSDYITCIKRFHEMKKDDLEDSVRGANMAENAQRGAMSALLGVALGGLIFTKQQGLPSADIFGAKTAVQGGFAAAIGASCSAFIYEAWGESKEKPAHADLEACQEEMKQAGFTEARYTELAEDLVKLFYFRESLLLGLKDKDMVDMRKGFKNQFYSQGDFDQTIFDLAIENYFLEQLNSLFQKAFDKIHQIHDEIITKEKQNNPFILWLKRHFESDENRHKFTQQMQIKFMTECIHFLERQMDEPGFMGKYPFVIDMIAGLIAATIAVAIFAVATWYIPVFALLCIAVGTACLAALCTHLLISKTEALYYKRDKHNRRKIHEAIDLVSKEEKRLATALERVIPTTDRELAKLKQYSEINKANFFTGKHAKHVALGSVRGWPREFAARFIESKNIEIELSNRINTLITEAHGQNESLQKALVLWMSSSPHTQVPQDLSHFIQETKKYLKSPEHANFINTFGLVQKIKEQILEIAGLIPTSMANKALPDILIDFYTDPESEGGLNGLKSDLDQARHLAPKVDEHVAADANHPYHLFLKTAQTVEYQLNTSPKTNLILPGDSRYRKILGITPDHGVRFEDKITISTIQDYLNESFNFLYSLNEYHSNKEWDQPFQNHDQFILYRMLLVTQLAHLVDPMNIRVDSFVKDAIKKFTKDKLNYNPDVAFNNILNQALLITPHPNGAMINNQVGTPCSLTELSYIADAIHVDMAYVSNSLSAHHLIDFEATHFLMNDNNKIIFGHNSVNKFFPECSEYFYLSVEGAIATTTTFIDAIKTRRLLQQTNTINIFLDVVANEIQQLQDKVNLTLQQPTVTTHEQDQLHNLWDKLDAFKKTIMSEDIIASETPIIPAETPKADEAKPVVMEVPAIPPAPTHDCQLMIDDLESFIKKEQNPSYISELKFHNNKAVDKIAAAETLIGELKKTGTWSEETILSNKTYKNKHLMEIMNKYRNALGHPEHSEGSPTYGKDLDHGSDQHSAKAGRSFTMFAKTWGVTKHQDNEIQSTGTLATLK